jgi:hypothetical protein
MLAACCRHILVPTSNTMSEEDADNDNQLTNIHMNLQEVSMTHANARCRMPVPFLLLS